MVALAAGAGAAGYAWLVPTAVAQVLRSELAARGYPDARLRVASVGLGHVHLRDVTLGEGLAVGEVELDAGLSLLWGGAAETLTIRGARLAAEAVARWSAQHGEGASHALPFSRIVLASSAIAFDGRLVPVTGTIDVRPGARAIELAAGGPLAFGGPLVRDATLVARERADGVVDACASARVETATATACTTLPLAAVRQLRALDLTWSAREAAATLTPWTARGRGRLAWTDGRGLTFQDGHVELTLPARTIGSVTLAQGQLSAAVAGRLVPASGDAAAELEVALDGELRAAHLALAGSAGVRLADVETAVALRASTRGGALRVAPLEPLVVRARQVTAQVADRPLRARDATVTVEDGVELAALEVPRVVRWAAAQIRWGSASVDQAAGTVLDLTRRTRGGAAAAARGASVHEVRWRAAQARWRDARLERPTGTIHLGRTQRATWRAPRGAWKGAGLRELRGTIGFAHGWTEQRIAWDAVAAPGPLAGGAGSLALRATEAHIEIEHGSTRALGGVLEIAPVACDVGAPVDVVLHARGLQLGRALRAAGRARVEASGLLDGTLVVRLDDGWSLTRAALQARGPGTLRIRDEALRTRLSHADAPFAIHARIAGALADFGYTQLALALGEPGASPELRVSLRGRGLRMAQELDLVLNLRGVRDTARRLSSRVDL